MKSLLVITPIGLLAVIVWAFYKSMQSSAKDWRILMDLESRVESLNTNDELLEFHKEFVEKANKIHNTHITPRLKHIDGYVKGKLSIINNKN